MEVDIQNIRPNPWNYNRQNPEMFKKEVLSLKKHGLITPIEVFRDPEDNDLFIIINGEHRYRAAKELKYETIPCTILEGISEKEAKEIGVKLNEIKGDTDANLLSKILNSLDIDEDTLIEEMPYDSQQLLNIMSLDSYDVDAELGLSINEDSLTDEEKEEIDNQYKSTIRLAFVLTQEEYDEYQSIKKKLEIVSDDDVFKTLCTYAQAHMFVKEVKTEETKKTKRSKVK